MKRIKILVITLSLALSFTSCSDFLSEVPDNRTQLNTSKKIGELLVTAYPTYSHVAFTELMSDNVFDCGDQTMGFVYQLSQYKWELEERITQDSPSAYWDGCYSAIAAANEALDAIDKLGGSDANLNALKGEALVARAYAHFMLVQLWSKSYNPNTASTDIGIPYVNKPERKLIQDYTRGTVESVYNNIEADLLAGLPLINDNGYTQPKFHFNKNAALAFATRFYTVKGEWDKVIEYSNYLAGKPKNLIRDYVAFSKVGINQMFQEYARPYHATNALIVTAVSSYNRYFSKSRFSLTGKEQASIMGKQFNPFGKEWLYAGGSFNGQKTYVYPKLGEYFKLENPTAGTGLPFVTYVLFSNDEAYLNRLEALVMTNRTAEAIAGLQFFTGSRTDRYNETTDVLTLAKLKSIYPVVSNELSPFYELTPDQTVLVKAILETKRRDFIQEGMRWFDIKRFDISVTHKFVTGETMILNKGDLRRQLPLPLHVTAVGIPDNPRN